MTYRFELRPDDGDVDRVRAALRAAACDRPYVVVELTEDTLVVLMQGEHIAEVIEVVDCANFVIAPIESRSTGSR